MSLEKNEPAPKVVGTLSAQEIQDREVLIKLMQEEVTIKPNSPKEKAFILDLLTTKIPLLANFLKRGSSIGNLSAQIAQLHHSSQALQGASTGLDFVSIGFGVIDFFRFPAIYLAAYIVGEPPPITLSNNARWLYSAVILGLSLTAILVPVTASPIALTLASLGLAVSVVTTVNLIYQRRQVRKGLNETNSEIEIETGKLKVLQEQAKKLELQLAGLKKNDEHYQQNATELCKEIDELNGRYSKTKEQLQTLHDKKLKQETKLGNMGGMAFMDKGVSIALSSLAIIGVVLTLLFPQIGLAILAATAALAVTYLVVRVTGPYILSGLKTVGSWLAGKFGYDTAEGDAPKLDNTLEKQSKDKPEPQIKEELSEDPHVQNDQSIKDSTLKTMEGLNSPEINRNLKTHREIDEIKTTTETLFRNNDIQSVDEAEVEIEEEKPGITQK